jgi:hypothetical protein
LKCVVCGKQQINGVLKKSRICESNRAEVFREAALFQLDEVYTRICDLDSDSRIFGADLYYHSSCFSSYILKYKRATNPSQGELVINTTKRDVFKRHIDFVNNIIDQGSGISLSEIRDMVNDKDGINITNSEVKTFLISLMNNHIQFCPSTRLNESLYVFSSDVSIEDVVKILRSLDATKEVASKIRKCLLKMDFGLNDSFCDAEELKHSWKNTVMPDQLVTFFSTLFNVNEAILRPNYYEDNSSLEEDLDIDEDKFDKSQHAQLKAVKIHSLFQIMCYNLQSGTMKTPLHIMNAHAIYEKCKSRELITSFNRTGMCVSYKQLRSYRTDLAKYAALACKDYGIPIPSHFSAKEFTLAAMDNFDHPDKTSTSGLSGTHDTAMTLFQVC